MARRAYAAAGDAANADRAISGAVSVFSALKLPAVGRLANLRLTRWRPGGEPMLGFAVIDRQPGASVTAVWLTSRVAPDRVGHTNAVCIHEDDTNGRAKVRALIADRIVILTTGSEPPVPLASPMTVESVESLVAETVEQQKRIVEAVDAYRARSRGRNLVRPEFPAAPEPPNLDIAGEDTAHRALATANYVARAWTAWLTTDEQRRRRTVDPRKGTSPWIMPEHMGSPTVAEFPAAFAEQVQLEPLRQC